MYDVAIHTQLDSAKYSIQFPEPNRTDIIAILIHTILMIMIHTTTRWMAFYNAPSNNSFLGLLITGAVEYKAGLERENMRKETEDKQN